MLVYFECLTAPYTVISGHGGCGRDDVYTACSNDVAFGVDGNMIKWYVSNNSFLMQCCVPFPVKDADT